MGAPYPPVPNTIRFRIQGTADPEIWENVLYFNYTGNAPTAASLITICNDVANQFIGQIAPLMHPNVSLTQTTAVDLASTQGAEATFVFTSPGQRSGGPLPGNTAFLSSFPVQMRWKGGHFRTYWLIGSDTDLANPMEWTTAALNIFTTGVNTFLSDCVGISAGGTTLSTHCGVRYHGKFLTNNGPPHFVLQSPFSLPIPANSAVGHQQLATQKGRIGRRRK
jgi:hypothetical protein